MDYRVRINNIDEGKLIISLIESIGYRKSFFERFSGIDSYFMKYGDHYEYFYIAIYDDYTYVFGENETNYFDRTISIDDYLTIIEMG